MVRRARSSFNLLAQTLNYTRVRETLFCFYFEELKMLYVWAPRPEDNLLLLHVHTLGVAGREARKDDSRLDIGQLFIWGENKLSVPLAPPGENLKTEFDLFRLYVYFLLCVFLWFSNRLGWCHSGVKKIAKAPSSVHLRLSVCALLLQHPISYLLCKSWRFAYINKCENVKYSD